MKKYLVTLVMALSLFASANAAMIHLGDTTGQPADVVSETLRLETLIGGYNLKLNTFSLPTTLGMTGLKSPVENGLTSFTMDLTGFDGYLMLKWGNMDDFRYISGETGKYTFYSDNFDRSLWAKSMPPHLEFSLQPPAGLSHFTTWVTPVPEPTTIVAGVLLLLPFAVSTIRRSRRLK